MRRALVLGATGHIGAHVVRALLRKGYAVRATYRNPRYRFVLDSLPIELHQLDLDNPRELPALASGCDWIVHCGGYYPRWRDRRSEALAHGIAQIQRTFDAIASCPIERVIFTSSAATIVSTSQHPATESDREPWPQTAPRPLYGSVKLAMEHEVERYAAKGTPVIFVHPSICLGEYDAHPFSGRLVLLYARGRCPVYTDHGLNVVYTGDVAAACVAAAEHGTVGDHYILANQNTTLRELAWLIAQEARAATPRWKLSYPLLMSAAIVSQAIATCTGREPLFSPRTVLDMRHRRHWLDSSKARAQLQLPQTPIDEAIRRTLAWFREHRYL